MTTKSFSYNNKDVILLLNLHAHAMEKDRADVLQKKSNIYFIYIYSMKFEEDIKATYFA